MGVEEMGERREMGRRGGEGDGEEMEEMGNGGRLICDMVYYLTPDP
jgi:hypothetical protein